MRASGLLVVMLALALPYRMRMRLAYALSLLSNKPLESAAFALRKPVALLNNVVLFVIYYAGVGASRAWASCARAWDGPPDMEGRWRPRGSPSSYLDDMEKPY